MKDTRLKKSDWEFFIIAQWDEMLRTRMSKESQSRVSNHLNTLYSKCLGPKQKEIVDINKKDRISREKSNSMNSLPFFNIYKIKSKVNETCVNPDSK